ncbi:MAG: WecB/TagA/CpsF family glycosyltransferase, partial [Anaerolineae bacterium]
MWDLAAAASELGISMAFVGAAPGVAAKAAQRLRDAHPDLRVEALHHGYFDKSDGASEGKAVIDAINAMSPDILVVGFGMPIQERWLAANWSHIDAGLALTGGGAFDYVSGERQRAPAWMTDHALEWLGRLVIEPRRLWRRYLVGNPLFVWRVFKQAVGIDRWPASDAALDRLDARDAI